MTEEGGRINRKGKGNSKDEFGFGDKKSGRKSKTKGKRKSQGHHASPFSMINFEMFDNYLDIDSPIIYESILFLKENKFGVFERYVKYWGKLHKTKKLQFFDHKKSLQPVKEIDLNDASYKTQRSTKNPFKIVIISNKKKYVLKGKNQMEYTDWKNLLNKFEVKELDETKVEVIPVEAAHEQGFVKKELKDWTNDDILEWAKVYRVGEEFETLYNVSGGELKKGDIDGKTILGIHEENILNYLLKLGIRSFDDRIGVRKDLLELRKNGKFDMKRAACREKAILLHQKHNMKISPSELDGWSEEKKDLYTPEVLKGKLLEYMISGEVKKNMTYKFRIKLIITENLQASRLKKLRKMFGNVLKVSPQMKSVQFGLFHVSISFGALQLDWNDSSFIHSRKNVSKNVILCLDVDNIQIKGEKLDDWVKDIANVCVAWNASYKYDSMKRNCQHFVLYLLKFLNIEYRFSETTQKFLDKMKYKGEHEHVVEFDSKFYKKFKGAFPKESKSKTFKSASHKELDEFMQRLLKICPNFETEHYSEYELLKAFDRAYWMRKYREEGSGKKTKHDPSKNGCPFNTKGDNSPRPSKENGKKKKRKRKKSDQRKK